MNRKLGNKLLQVRKHKGSVSLVHSCYGLNVFVLSETCVGNLLPMHACWGMEPSERCVDPEGFVFMNETGVNLA